MINHMHTFKIKLNNIGEVNLIKKKKIRFWALQQNLIKLNSLKYLKV